MALNPEKVERALAKSKRVRGIRVPASLDMGFEKLLVTRQRRLWMLSIDAALKHLPVDVDDSATVFVDAVPAAMNAAVNAVYSQYAGMKTLKKQMDEQFKKGEKFHRASFVRQLNAVIGVGIEDLLSDKRAKAAVEKRLKDSVGLIKSLDGEMKKRLLSEIQEHIEKGKGGLNIRKLAEQGLKKGVANPVYRARLIARDQMGKLFANLAQTRQEDIGVTEYIWSTVGDGAVRPHHVARDGDRFKWSEPPEGGHPGEEVQCRCTAEPYLKSAKTAALLEEAA